MATNSTVRPGKRDRLVDAARELIHRQGVSRTTLAEIAVAADVPVGNLYYYFKTKDEIIVAVVEKYAEQLSAAFETIERRYDDPVDRLIAHVQLQASQAAQSPPEHGCPYGTLSAELARRPGGPDPLSSRLIEIQLDWLEQQFRAMSRPDPRAAAVELVAAWQGAGVISSTLSEPKIMAEEARRLEQLITAART